MEDGGQGTVTGNGERKIKNGERGACNVERRKESQSNGTKVN